MQTIVKKKNAKENNIRYPKIILNNKRPGYVLYMKWLEYKKWACTQYSVFVNKYLAKALDLTMNIGERKPVSTAVILGNCIHKTIL